MESFPSLGTSLLSFTSLNSALPAVQLLAATLPCLHEPLSGRFSLLALTHLVPAFCPQLFLKEHLHQLLESMREHVLNLAALTLQRHLRGFFIQRRFRSLRRKIILLQSRARGYLARWGSKKAGLPGTLCSGLGEAMLKLKQ